MPWRLTDPQNRFSFSGIGGRLSELQELASNPSATMHAYESAFWDDLLQDLANVGLRRVIRHYDATAFKIDRQRCAIRLSAARAAHCAALA